MPVPCPHCGVELATGALRCRSCGERGPGLHAVESPPQEERRGGVGFTAALGAVLEPRQMDAIDALRRLLELAPAVRRWLALPEPRGPMPDVRARDRAEVERLVAIVHAAPIRRP